MPLRQASDGLWHSGNGSGYASEYGCPHLPECPPEWPFDKDQWLAFDLGPTRNPNFSRDWYFIAEQTAPAPATFSTPNPEPQERVLC